MIITLGDSNAGRIAATASALESCGCDILYLGLGPTGGNAWQIFARVPRKFTESELLALVHKKLNPAPIPVKVHNGE